MAKKQVGPKCVFDELSLFIKEHPSTRDDASDKRYKPLLLETGGLQFYLYQTSRGNKDPFILIKSQGKKVYQTTFRLSSGVERRSEAHTDSSFRHELIDNMVLSKSFSEHLSNTLPEKPAPKASEVVKAKL